MPPTEPNAAARTAKPPLKYRLWKLFAILFYATVAVGAVYHLIVPLFR